MLSEVFGQGYSHCSSKKHARSTLQLQNQIPPETAAQAKLNINTEMKSFVQYQDSFNKSLKGKMQTQEPVTETHTFTDIIEFPEIPRRLLLCLRDDFII